jgi:hypothetical protein
MPALDARFRRVTGRAQGLEIGEVEGEFRVRAHGPDVINFEPDTRSALDALPAIAAQRLQPEGLPAAGFENGPAMTGPAV